jgi:hypothetical protein
MLGIVFDDGSLGGPEGGVKGETQHAEKGKGMEKEETQQGKSLRSEPFGKRAMGLGVGTF